MHFDVTIGLHEFKSSILISLGKSSPWRSTYDSYDPLVVQLRPFVEFRDCPLRPLRTKQNRPLQLSSGQQPCLFVGQYVDYQHSHKVRSFKHVTSQCIAQKPVQWERLEIVVRHLGGIVTDMIVTVPVQWPWQSLALRAGQLWFPRLINDKCSVLLRLRKSCRQAAEPAYVRELFWTKLERNVKQNVSIFGTLSKISMKIQR